MFSGTSYGPPKMAACLCRTGRWPICSGTLGGTWGAKLPGRITNHMPGSSAGQTLACLYN